MSTLTQRPVRIYGVRGAMRKQGMAAEDLAFVKLMADSCRAYVEGDEMGASELIFQPASQPKPIRSKVSISSFEQGLVPGNALIVIESALPVLARTGGLSSVTVQGETYNSNTLTYDSFETTTLAAHRAQGLYVTSRQSQTGFGYGSKGEVTVDVEPSVLQGIDWSKRGQLQSVRGVITYSDLSPDIAERGAAELSSLFAVRGWKGDIESVNAPGKTPGIFVTVSAHFDSGMGSGCAMGQRGMQMESVCRSACKALDEWIDSGTSVDTYLADQLLLPAVLAEGKTTYETPKVTRRLTTMAWLMRQFLPIRLTLHGQEGYPGLVTIER
ncbi:MAG: hypothetical protein KIT11_08330 [Fimbriimonadaceae bacterium]|nr:hypothetical protein [Fimbriimonadaceae bacterium]QYK56359.1 MAG: hypothetical protein KF733_02525 [Fimbriimonadaceae bacterium]